MPSTLQLQMKMDEVPSVLADKVQIEQVLLNLCINARDALNGVGTVNVTVHHVVMVDVVCASCRQRIVGEFVELAVSDTVHGIVNEHGGHIIVDTVTGRCTTFRILLAPAAAPASALVPGDAGGAESRTALSR